MNRSLLLLAISASIVLVSYLEVLGAQEPLRPPAPCRFRGDPLIPGLSSFFIPGLGQFMNGDDHKGFTHLVVAVGLPTLVVIAGRLLGEMGLWQMRETLFITAPLLYLGWGLHSGMDAYRVAETYCKR